MSYLEELKQIPRVGHESANTVMPPLLAGESAVSHPVIATMRLRQLLNLLKAYDIPHNPNMTLKPARKIADAANDNGMFSGPPKNPYYFMMAKYTSDEVQSAKLNGGYFTRKYTGRVDTQVPCEALFPWKGPAPDPAPAPKKFGSEVVKERQRANSQKGVIAQLRKQCKELGLNSFGKGREELARMIAEKTGAMQKSEPVSET